MIDLIIIRHFFFRQKINFYLLGPPPGMTSLTDTSVEFVKNIKKFNIKISMSTFFFTSYK